MKKLVKIAAAAGFIVLGWMIILRISEKRLLEWQRIGTGAELRSISTSSYYSPFKLVVWREKIWAIGEKHVVNSENGVEWDMVSPTTEYYQQHESSIDSALVFKDQLYLFRGSEKSSIWRSDNGANWHFVTDNLPVDLRELRGKLVHAGMIWLAGGNYSQEWLLQSDDGKNWREVKMSQAFRTSFFQELIYFDDHFWLVGGYEGSFYRSKDGISWEWVRSEIPLPDRDAASYIVFANKLWMIGGTRIPGLLKTIITDPLSLLVMQGSSNHDYLSDVWYTEDGINWHCSSRSGPFAGRSNATLLNFNNEIWMIGGSVKGHMQEADIWKASLR